MKYLFWLLIALLAWWAYTRMRKAEQVKNAPPTSQAPQDMVPCAHCGIHLPRGEAVAGEKGLYCSTAHRSDAQDRNPA